MSDDWNEGGPARPSQEGNALPVPGKLRSADSLFAEFLAREESTSEPDFDAFCAEHPEHAEELRRLFESMVSVLERLRAPPVSVSLAKRLEEIHGERIDPGVSLREGPSGEQGDPSSEVIDRLSAHTPPQTRYRLKGELARGGMGVILKVWDEDLRRNLAMKVILGSAEGTSTGATPRVHPKSLGRFLEEAQVTGQLEHPGIVPVHELGLDADGRVYFTMRLVKGQDLRHVFDLVEDDLEGWSVTRALSIILRVCETMAFAHDRGVIHRDLKPANIMVGKFGEVYVMDWGLARVMGREDRKDIRIRKPSLTTTSAIRTDRKELTPSDPESPLVTMDGDVVGTPAYMPPEQAAGRVEQVGPRSDVYAVGAILYRLLTGRTPYTLPDAHVSPYTVLGLVQHGPPTSIQELNPDVPGELAAICEKAMARKVEDRYTRMEHVAEDLRAFLEHRVVAAYESGAIAELRKWVKRNKGITAMAAAVLVVFLSGMLWWGTRPGYLSVIVGNVPDAEVFVDGDRVGTLPLDPLLVSAGAHRIRIEKTDFEPYDAMISVPRTMRKDASYELKVDLASSFGTVMLESDPPGGTAELIGMGRRIRIKGILPAVDVVPAGTYEVHVDGQPRGPIRVPTGGARVAWKTTFPAGQLVLLPRSTPMTMEVFRAGEPDPIARPLRADDKLTLLVGEYEVRASAPDHLTRTFPVTIQDRRQSTLGISLPPVTRVWEAGMRAGTEVLATTDLDQDGILELVVGTADGRVTVFDFFGSEVWTAEVSTRREDTDDPSPVQIIRSGRLGASLLPSLLVGVPEQLCILDDPGNKTTVECPGIQSWIDLRVVDLDGDALPEIIAIGRLKRRVSDRVNPGRVFAFDGAGALLWEREFEDGIDAVGFPEGDHETVLWLGTLQRIEVLGPDGKTNKELTIQGRCQSLVICDLDGDGIEEAVAMMTSSSHSMAGMHPVVAFDHTGRRLWSRSFASPWLDLVVVNADIPEMLRIILATTDDGSKAIDASGNLAWTHSDEASFHHQLVADMDGNGRDEIVHTTNDLVEILDGMSGERLSSSRLGRRARLLGVPDLEGDGVREIAVATDYDRIIFLAADGRESGLLLTQTLRSYESLFVDLEGDGRDELVLGLSTGRLSVRGVDPERLWNIDISGKVLCLNAGDMDGDGLPEVAVATDSGRVHVLGRTGATLFVAEREGSVNDLVILEQPMADGTVLVGGTSLGNLFGLDAAGMETWKMAASGAIGVILVEDAPIGLGSVVYFGGAGFVASCDLTGHLLWQVPVDGWVSDLTACQLQKAGPGEIVACTKTETVAISRTGDDVLWHWRTPLDFTTQWVAMDVAESLGGPGSEVVVGLSGGAVVILSAEGLLVEYINVTGLIYDVRVLDLEADGSPGILLAANSDTLLVNPRGSGRWVDHSDPWARGNRSVLFADVDGDGSAEVITDTYDRFVQILDHSGRRLWRHRAVASWGEILAVDLDGDGSCEIVSAGSDGYVEALKPRFPDPRAEERRRFLDALALAEAGEGDLAAVGFEQATLRWVEFDDIGIDRIIARLLGAPVPAAREQATRLLKRRGNDPELRHNLLLETLKAGSFDAALTLVDLDSFELRSKRGNEWRVIISSAKRILASENPKPQHLELALSLARSAQEHSQRSGGGAGMEEAFALDAVGEVCVRLGRVEEAMAASERALRILKWVERGLNLQTEEEAAMYIAELSGLFPRLIVKMGELPTPAMALARVRSMPAGERAAYETAVADGLSSVEERLRQLRGTSEER